MEAKKLTYKEFRNEVKKGFVKKYKCNEKTAEQYAEESEDVIEHFFNYYHPAKDRYFPGLLATCLYNCD